MEGTKESETLMAALNILRNSRVEDTSKTYTCLEQLLSSNPDALEEFKQNVHVPLQVGTDTKGNDDAMDERRYILSPYNQSSNGSYRSPWASIDDESLDALQSHANELWQTYVELYYGKSSNSAVGSVYLVTSESHNNNNNNKPFEGCFLLKNCTTYGEWNSIHHVQVTPTPTNKSTATYSIHSQVYIIFDDSISSHLSKESTMVLPFKSAAHCMETIGPLLESIEKELRSSLENVVLPKTRDVVTGIRRKQRQSMMKVTPGMNHTAMLNEAVLARATMQHKS